MANSLALAFILAAALTSQARAQSVLSLPTVDDVRITILSDMIVGRWTTAEWGFSALVEVKTGGSWKKILFDTGAAPGTVKQNAARLGVSLCDAETVVLSHNHQDHTMGLYELRKSCMKSNSAALGTTYVGGPQIFWSRPYPANGGPMGRLDDNVLVPRNGAARAFGLDPEYEQGIKALYENAGGRFVVPSAAGPVALPGLPGVWLTGSIPRAYDEKTYPNTPFAVDPVTGRASSDTVPEDQALVINTSRGLIVLAGCAHAGVLNTVLYAHTMLGSPQRIFAILGGLHTFEMKIGSPSQTGTLAWEAAQLSDPALGGVEWLLGAHCTGIGAVRYLSEHIAGLDPANGFVGAIGTVFSPGSGIVAPRGISNPNRKAMVGNHKLEAALRFLDKTAGADLGPLLRP